MILTTKNTNGKLEIHEYSSHVLSKKIIITADFNDFALLKNSLFVVSEDRELLRIDLTTNSTFQGTGYDQCKTIYSSSEYLLVLTYSNELILFKENLSVFRYKKLDFEIKNVNIGLEGTIWLTGGGEITGGYKTYYSEDFENFNHIPPPAAAVNVFGDDKGIAWTVNSRNEIWKLHRKGEGHMPGCKLNPSCRDCMFGKYSQVKQIAYNNDVFLVLSNDGVLRFYNNPGDNNIIASIEDIEKFTLN